MFKVVKQEGDNDMWWVYNTIDALDIKDPTQLVQVLAESQRTFSVSENEAKIIQNNKQIAEIQKENGELKAEIDATKDESSVLEHSIIELKK